MISKAFASDQTCRNQTVEQTPSRSSKSHILSIIDPSFRDPLVFRIFNDTADSGLSEHRVYLHPPVHDHVLSFSPWLSPWGYIYIPIFSEPPLKKSNGKSPETSHSPAQVLASGRRDQHQPDRRDRESPKAPWVSIPKHGRRTWTNWATSMDWDTYKWQN